MKSPSKYVSGIAAVGIYFLIVGLVFYYFGYRRSEKQKHYVEKNSKAISVSLAGAKKPKQVKKYKPKPKTKPKSKSRPKSKKSTKPKPIKRNKPDKPAEKPEKKIAKKIKPKSLFSKVKTEPKAKSKPNKVENVQKAKTNKGSAKGTSSVKNNKNTDKGIENKYLATVQDKLYGWPSQSNFAGAMVVIGLNIQPDGSFEYEVLQHSSNPEFDRAIELYLDQLGSTGFGSTPTGKKYKFKVEIIAK